MSLRILIVKTSSMGDVVHALPAVQDLRRALGPSADVEIDWLVEPAFAALPELHAGVAQVHRLAWRRWRKALTQRATWQAMGELTERLRARRYDLVIDLQGLLKSAWWARRAGVPVHGYDRHSIREPLASLLYAQTHRVARSLHAVQRCRLLAMSALCTFDARASMQPGGEPDFGLHGLDPYRHEDLAAGYALLIPNASRPEKYWPEADWQAMGREFASRGWQPVVLWGRPDEEAMARRIAEGCGAWVPPFLTVEEAARLLAGAAVVVGLDTGFTHVAAALGRPVVGIYCDHEPGLTGITGPAPGASLGGKGQRPARQAVLGALSQVCEAAGFRR